MFLTQRLGEHIAAAFSGIWIQSYEHQDAMAEIARLCCVSLSAQNRFFRTFREG
jgi:hypothetical protein